MKKGLSFWIGSVCMILLVCFIMKSQMEISKTKEEITNNGDVTIGKVYAFKSYKNSRSYSYYYFVDNVKYRNTYDSDIGYGENAIDHFYEVRVLKNNPTKSMLYLENEIDDEKEILNSGFKMVKSAYFDPNKNEYFKDSVINYK